MTSDSLFKGWGGGAVAKSP